MNLKRIIAVLALAIPNLAVPETYGASYGMVQDVTAENMPNYVAFKLSSMPSYCQPQNGQYFSFGNGNPDTVKAVYAMVMAAVLSGKSVWVLYGNSNQCNALQVHGVY
jgi:hypothetical protein